MRGGTITVTNLGEQGVENIYPVIYPPQVAMVGFGSIRELPWVVSGQILLRPILKALQRDILPKDYPQLSSLDSCLYYLSGN